MTRILKTKRCEVINTILKNKYKDRLDNVRKEAEETYMELVKAYAGKYWETFKELPEHFVDTAKLYNMVSIVDPRGAPSGLGLSHFFGLGTHRFNHYFIVSSTSSGLKLIHIPNLHSQAVKVRDEVMLKVSQIYAELEDIRKSFHSDIEYLYALLSGYSTVEKLEKDYPELAKLFPKETPVKHEIVAISEEQKEQVKTRFNLPIPEVTPE